MTIKIAEWMENCYQNYVLNLAKSTQLDYSFFALNYSTQYNSYIANPYYQSTFRFFEYFSCSFSNDYIQSTIYEINENLMVVLYLLMVDFFFNYIFTVLSAVFGLMSILINFKIFQEGEAVKQKIA